MLLRGQNSIESLLDKSLALLGRSERLPFILFQVFRVTVTHTHYIHVFGLCPRSCHTPIPLTSLEGRGLDIELSSTASDGQSCLWHEASAEILRKDAFGRASGLVNKWRSWERGVPREGLEALWPSPIPSPHACLPSGCP